MAAGMIESRDRDGVRRITVTRPERRNALTVDGLEALERAITSAPVGGVSTGSEGKKSDETDAVSVLYLEGAGEAFCAGADLDVVADLDRSSAEEFSRLGQRVGRALEASPAITIAGIDGAARGGGLELALACDLRVATPDATFGEPGVTFGLFGAWGGTHRLPAIVGLGNALDLAMTGRVLSAEQAVRMGLISQIRERPRTVAETVADHPPETCAVLKRRLRDTADQESQERAEAEAFGALLESNLEAIRDLRDGESG